MLKHLKFMSLGLTALLLAGCSSITNLTPSQHSRNASGLYPFEVEWNSAQHTIRKDSLKPSVIIGLQSYPMQRTPMVSNRWETLIPVSVTNQAVYYRFKFDYEVNSIPVPKANSKLSPTYQLQIEE